MNGNYNHTLLEQRYNEANKATDEEFLEWYNGLTVVVLHDAEMPDVFNRIMKNGVWDKLDAAAENMALDAIHPTIRRKIKKFLAAPATGIKYLNPKTDEVVENLPAVVQLTEVTQEEADDFMTLFQEHTSQSLIDHGRPTTQIDLNVMRNQGKIATARQKVANWSAALQSLELGNDVDIEDVA